MHIHSLQKKRICILGFGREGQATLRALEKYAPDSHITIADKNKELEIRNYEYQHGEHYLKNLDRFDVIIKSPGIPPSLLAPYNLTPKTYHLTNATQIFLDTIADSGATVIGVTGSKGKSTTASLIYEILSRQSRVSSLESRVYLIGNIGSPALDFLEHAKLNTIFVHELSSYQLADLTVSPHIAVITSFFPEHLDYHGSLEEYTEAKRNICRFQRETDIVFYASQNEGAYEIAAASVGKKIPFSEQDAPVSLQETQLIGTHNLRNIAAAWKVAEHCGIPRNVAIQTIREFQPLPHRLQSLGVHCGIEWVDDAISTTPESTIAALDALGDRVATVILGGLDRGYDFTALAERIASSSIQTVILFPGSGPRIRATLEAIHANAAILNAHTMDEAVSVAKNVTSNEQRATSNTPIVLLSTASPSYNMFKNFEEKGDCFQKTITSDSMSLSCSSAPSRKPPGSSCLSSALSRSSRRSRQARGLSSSAWNYWD